MSDFTETVALVLSENEDSDATKVGSVNAAINIDADATEAIQDLFVLIFQNILKITVR